MSTDFMEDVVFHIWK